MVTALRVLHRVLVSLLSPRLGAATEDIMDIDFASRLEKGRPWPWPPIFRLGSGAGNEVVGPSQAPGLGSKPFEPYEPKSLP